MGGCGTRCGTPPHRLAPVSMYPCRKAPRPARRPDDQPHRAARCVTHSSAPSWSSAASAPRAPGRGRAYSPRPIPWPCSSATTRQTFTPSSSAGTTSRPAWPCSSRANFSSARRGSWFARMGVSFGLRSRLPAWPLSPTADRPGDRRRGGPSLGQSHREPDPRMADDPRAQTLYRRGDVRRRSAPARPPPVGTRSRASS